MKRTFTLLILCITYLTSFADQGGPDSWGYTWKDSDEPDGPEYNWIDILEFNNATQVKLLADDNLRGPFFLNFDFHYYWYDVNQFWVGSNGYIKFNDLGQLASPFPTAPSSAIPNDYIGVYMNDLQFAGEGDTAECWYWISSGLDTLIVSYINVGYWSPSYPYTTGKNTFQVILSAVDSSITFQYKERTGTSQSCTSIGFENNSGGIGLQIIPVCNEPPQGYAVKIYPAVNPTLEVLDVEPYYIDNPGTGAIFLAKSDETYEITALIQNSGNITATSIPCELEIKSPSGDVIVVDTQYVASLEAGQSELLSFFLELTPNLLGTYKHVRVKTMLAGDDVSGNNNEKLEVIVVDTTLDEVLLGYDAGNTNQITTVNWAGTGGGAGQYFVPPYYPVQITKIHYYIYFGNGVPYVARVWDDDGINGLPFTILDSITVDPGDITDFAWNELVLDDPIVINSGGFYVSWNMLGSGQTLGSSTKDPFSHRSYEVFEDAFGAYRFGQDQDPMISATIAQYAFPTGTNGQPLGDIQADFFPNPADEEMYVIFSVTNYSEEVLLKIFNFSGQLVAEKNLGIHSSGTQQVLINVSDLPSGMYLAEISCAGNKHQEKLVVK
jgi:hypothetical protein